MLSISCSVNDVVFASHSHAGSFDVAALWRLVSSMRFISTDGLESVGVCFVPGMHHHSDMAYFRAPSTVAARRLGDSFHAFSSKRLCDMVHPCVGPGFYFYKSPPKGSE